MVDPEDGFVENNSDVDESDMELSDVEEESNSKAIISKTIDDDDDVDPELIDDDDDDDDDVDIDDEDEINNMNSEDEINDSNINIAMKENRKQKIFELSDSDEDSDDDTYLQKFDQNIQEDTIDKYHPELHHHNYDDIKHLSKTVRNENGVIIDPLHRTVPFITKYEKSRVIGERAKQINNGANPMVEIEPTVIDGYLIALKEFEEKKIPFIIKRPLPNGGCEYWKLSDLEILV